MKHLGKIAFGALALMLTACSSDEPVAPNATDEAAEGEVYASLTLKLPTAAGTRAADGYEIGQDDENAVNSVLVVLATKNAAGKYVYFARGESNSPQMGDVDATGRIKCTVSFNAKEMNPSMLDTLANGTSITDGKELYLFAFCNPTSNFKSELSKQTSSERDKVIDNLSVFYGTEFKDQSALPIWEANNFFMSNKSIVKVENMPSRNELIEKHSSVETAFPLGEVEVIRACARFDFATVNDNKYDITGVDGKTVIGQVVLTDMALFNQQRGIFYMARTSKTWNWVNSTESPYDLCGDLESNYVMSYDYGNFKTAVPLSLTDIVANYAYVLVGGSSNNFEWTSIDPEKWNEKRADYDENWNYNNRDYRIWRYTTENTIPRGTGETYTQKIGITTGVAFRAEFIPTDTETWNGNVVYVYNGVVYGDYAKLKEYCDNHSSSQVATDFVTSLTEPSASTNHKTTSLLNERNVKFKAYRPTSDGKYRMYYFYYNRHNNNGKDTQMGNNEFGVVRNNVYKLAVTKIGSFGDPDIPEENDKDDPDENENAYFTVSCYVMPWTVRVNDISF